uniref:C-C motif chemokine n=1 Tax=Astyanax mexicanus TaxID=7994 RepID=W5KDK8_ASTMX
SVCSSGYFLVGLLLGNMNEPAVCCFIFYKGTIPLQRIMKYETTIPQCPKPGVIFTLWSGKRVCVDPTPGWVKQTMVKLDKRALGN